MLSLHTNAAALSAQNSISRTQSSLSTSQTNLSTGFRVNSAMDDAAGLQIATRLKYQTSGMAVAMRNTQNSISMMQTAEGALDETTNILVRMKDLATQAADGSSTTADRTAMQSEYDALGKELTNIIGNTGFGGNSLIGTKADSKFNAAISFQIGTSTAEKMDVDISVDLQAMHTAVGASTALFAATGTAPAGPGTEFGTAASANTIIDTLATAIDSVSTVRSSLGAVSNRLEHVNNNLANVSTNTKAATGRIMDTDFATESSNMTSSQMLLQAGTAMLKQSNSTSSLVMSLLQ
ncbi:flagellin [Duganella sp. CF517]|uniref:flagellin N-terminal helical domain-containing protein n=1 Tax=Duganella sp. CF517 TaxID=1881038 RepID=UPI0008C988EB|nr:flagellin [Duganella sp. CF517]SEN13450.1 flagellin [Duganella sp. CF517]